MIVNQLFQLLNVSLQKGTISPEEARRIIVEFPKKPTQRYMVNPAAKRFGRP